MYPSIHWEGGLCISACTAQGVSAWGVSAQGRGCLPGGVCWGGVCLGGVCPGGCLPRRCLPRVRGVCPVCGVSEQGVGCLPGGCVCLGVSTHGGVADPPPPRGRKKGRSDAYLRDKYKLWSKGNSIGYWFVDVNAFALTSVYFLQRWFTEDAGRQ